MNKKSCDPSGRKLEPSLGEYKGFSGICIKNSPISER